MRVVLHVEADRPAVVQPHRQPVALAGCVPFDAFDAAERAVLHPQPALVPQEITARMAEAIGECTR